MTPAEIELRVREILDQSCRRKAASLAPGDDLVETLGLDSLEGLQVLAAVEKRFGVRFPDERLAQLRTVRALVDAIQSSPPRKPS